MAFRRKYRPRGRRYGRRPIRRAVRPARRKVYRKKVQHFRNMMIRASQKKTWTNYLGSTVQVGQVSNNASGDYVMDITPAPSQGTSYGSRIGDEIYVTGIRMKMNIWGQSACNHLGRLKLIVFGFRQPSNSSSISTISGAFHNSYLVNPMLLGNTSVNVWDFGSEIDPRNNGTDFVPIRTTSITIPAPQYSGQVVPRELIVGVKFRRPWRVVYFPGTNNVDFGQLGMAILADSGNAGGSNNTNMTALIPVAANSSGWNINISQYAFYTDTASG